MNALRPIIIYINHFDFHAVDELLSIISKDAAIHEYNEAGHYVDFKTKVAKGVIAESDNLEGFWAAFDDNFPQKAFIVLKDAHHYFMKEYCAHNPRVIALINSCYAKTLLSPG
ncbi:MAG: hypothetical protein LBC27_06940 [Spirochaetaceae bacterium]|nr:hypothetical protein [Spirochaetaceae bacterium]